MIGREVSETAIPPRRSPPTPARPRASGGAEDRKTRASLLRWPQRRGRPSCPMAVRDGATEPPVWKGATIIQHSTRVRTAACGRSGGGMADVRPHPHEVIVHAVRRMRGAGQKTRETQDVITRWTFHARCVESSADHHRYPCFRDYGIVAVLGDAGALSG
jgi:hypothetical protein